MNTKWMRGKAKQVQSENKKRITIILFAIAFWTLILRQMSGMMAIVPYFSKLAEWYGNRMLFAGIVVLAAAILLQGMSIPELFICIWSVISIRICDNTMLMILVFLVVAAKNIDHKLITKLWLVPVGGILLAAMFLYPVLLNSGPAYAVMYDGRWTFFFNHPNSFGLWFSFAILALVYLLNKRMPIWGKGLLLFGGAGLLIAFPNCKTDAVILILAIFVLLAHEFVPKLWRIGMISMPWLCIGLTVVCTWLYYTGRVLCDQYLIHKTFSMRFQDAAIALSIAKPNMVGQRITHLGGTISFYGVERSLLSLDNAYIAAILYYGIPVGCAITGMIVWAINRKLKEKESKSEMEAILLLLVFVMGMMELPAWYGTIAFPLLFTGGLKIRRIRFNDKEKSEAT